jgi:ABC-type uncharacterized transport system substrate-binding protein
LTLDFEFDIHVISVMDKKAMRKNKKSSWAALTAPIFLVVVFLSLMGAEVLCPRQSHAHPHAFILQRLTLLFDEKGMAGVRVWWKFDDMFASMIIEEHDKNRNGKFEAGEIQTIKDSAFEQISQHNYFTFIRIDSSPFPVKFIKDFKAVIKNQRLVYEFTVPCHVVATVQPKKISVGCYDPTYYSAIFFAKNDPVKIIKGDAFDVQTAIRQDPDTLIYFDMIHPWVLFLEFRAIK